MKKYLIYILCFFCVNVLAQNTYQFDYMSVYEYKANEEDTITSIQYRFASSKNSNIIIYLNKYKNGKISADLFDFYTGLRYEFDLKGITNIEETSLVRIFNKPITHNILPNHLKKEKIVDKYNVIYDREDGKNKIIVERFKNIRKKKKLSEIHYLTESYPFVKNQFYSSNVSFAYTFDISKIKTDEVIIKSYTIISKAKTNEKIHLWELKTIKPFDLEINIPKSE